MKDLITELRSYKGDSFIVRHAHEAADALEKLSAEVEQLKAESLRWGMPSDIASNSSAGIVKQDVDNTEHSYAGYRGEADPRSAVPDLYIDEYGHWRAPNGLTITGSMECRTPQPTVYATEKLWQLMLAHSEEKINTLTRQRDIAVGALEKFADDRGTRSVAREALAEINHARP